MILFQDDWRREGASIHEDTRNKSFIRLCMVLKSMNIKNYAFPMALLQPELAPYDPHNLTDNSQELRLKIGLECKLNPWYMFREVLRVPTSGGEPGPLDANRANIAMIWCFYNNLSYIAIQPRQTGKSIVACSLIATILYITGLRMRMILYTKDTKLLQENVARIKMIRDALPPYLVHQQQADTDNKEGLSYARFQNHYLTTVAQSSAQAADNLGRGMTAPVIHIDEPAFCDNINITYTKMMLSTIRAVKDAEKFGQPHSNLLTTTAAPLDTLRGKYTYDLVCGAMPMTETLYDTKNKEDATRIVRANSANGMINGTYSYIMLGYDRQWLEDAIRIGQGTKDDNDRELLNIWKTSGNDALLDPLTIDLLNKHIHDPVWHEQLGDYVLKWYVDEATVKAPEFVRRKLVLAMDSSENIGEDFTTLVLIDAADMAVLAVFRCNATNTIKLGMFIADLLLLYRNITFIPERNSTGGAIIDTIVLTFRNHGINPFRRIYNQVVQDRKLEAMKQIDLDDPDITETSIKKYLGFRTTTKTRPFLYKNTLKKAVGLNIQRIHDRSLITELSALSVVNGRIDHSEGQHDDTVIAYLLACWLLFYGENLSYYGITAQDILTRVAADGSAVDIAHRDHQLGIRRMIKFYQDLVDRTNSQVIRSNYLQKILSLKNQLDPNLNLEPIGMTKVHQDVQDYGHTHYTPQAIAARTQSTQRTTQALDMLRSLAF